MQARYLALLRQHNADRLQGIGDSAALPPGTELAMPDTKELSATALAEPSTASRSPQKSITTRSSESAPPHKSKAANGVSRPRLVVGGDERSSLQLATGLAGHKELSEPEREKLRTELQLIATLDDKIATQLELSEKLRQLEALQVQLQSDVQGLEQRIRAQQATLQANSIPNASPQPGNPPAQATSKASIPADTTNPSTWTFTWQDALLPIGGIVILILLLLGWRRYRHGSSYAEAVELAPLADEESGAGGTACRRSFRAAIGRGHLARSGERQASAGYAGEHRSPQPVRPRATIRFAYR